MAGITMRNLVRRCTAIGMTSILWLAFSQMTAAQWNEKSPSAAERDQQYKELATESEQLQREANVLRKVVHLVKPAVVHIDSEHTDSVSRYRHADVEEAGSGTI